MRLSKKDWGSSQKSLSGFVFREADLSEGEVNAARGNGRRGLKRQENMTIGMF
jgi:hypothetical protein